MKIQEERERDTMHFACLRYEELMSDMKKMGKLTHMRQAESVISKWLPQAAEMIDQEKEAFERKEAAPDRKVYGPIFCGLDSVTHRNGKKNVITQSGAFKLAVITLHTMVNSISSGMGAHSAADKGVGFRFLCKSIANGVESEYNLSLLRKKEKELKKNQSEESKAEHKDSKQLNKALMSPGLTSADARRLRIRVRDVLEENEWGIDMKVKVGAILIKIVLEACKDRDGNPAFRHETIQAKYAHKVGSVIMSDCAYEELCGTEHKPLAQIRDLPMVVPPQPWLRWDKGGYLSVPTKIMRTHGYRAHSDALRVADLDQVLAGLNALNKLPWRVNHEVLDVAREAWDQRMAIAELPERTDIPELEPLSEEEDADPLIRKRHYWQQKKIIRNNCELHSQRCDTILKLNIAQENRDYVIYFPYNLDFRGRAYPIPPNLNHLGSDLCRGLLKFEKKKPLGEKGLWWLKVHLANLYGFDKANFNDRMQFTMDHMSEVYDSAARPLEGNRWWTKAESPWQVLAVCKELTEALSHPNPEAFESGMPVHMDGSCNGLQHYAALGRDVEGGASVNLTPHHEPQDVYMEVCAIVNHKIDEDFSRAMTTASEELTEDHRFAKRLKGMVDRKVIKQTVMTSVYGVTFVGARRQIMGQLEEKFIEAGMHPDEVDREAYAASGYLARHTLEALKELFGGARDIMEWLGTCAQLISKQERDMNEDTFKGDVVSWVTPLGLPVTQPYRKFGTTMVKTVLQTVQVEMGHDKHPANSKRQRSAFPPNFVHSLDSTHMLLTAVKMDRMGIDFTAVHDSYWSHACNVDVMNDTLRGCFVDLYSQPILENLREDFITRYPNINFPEIPDRGELNLELVRQSAYFFN